MNKTLQALVLILSGTLIASNLYTMLPLHPSLAVQFDTTAATTSLTSTLFILTYAFGLLFFGILADIVPNTHTLKAGMAAVTIVTGVIFFTDSLIALCILRALQGFFAASFAPTAFSYTFKTFQDKQQAFVIAMINTGFLFAGILGQLIAAYFGLTYAYQTVFLVFCLLYGLCALLFLFSLRPTDKVDEKQRVLSLSTILSFFVHRSLQKLYVITFFLLFTIMFFYSSFEWFAARADTSLMFTLQQFRLIGLVGIIPAFFVRTLQKQLGSSRLLSLFLLLMVIGFLPALIHVNSATLLFASVMMIASTSVTIPMVILLIGTIASHRRGSALSFYSFLLLTGASFGPMIAPIFSFGAMLLSVTLLFIGLTCLGAKITIQKTTAES
ncbi:MFS transporter [Thalassobacillus hwangdonensis]|uniref:MFS transporter n=1 Tax=Thalassobacillus hwangdonensis TaxID=546108 RepID=A0ABW3KVA5_9BACI